MSEQKQFTRAQVAERDNKENAVFIIHNRVYDVTPFLDEHPGGHEVLARAAGRDASEDFDDIGHSIDAKELMKKYQIGEIVEHEHIEAKKKDYKWEDVKNLGEEGALASWRLPLLAALVATVLWYWLT